MATLKGSAVLLAYAYPPLAVIGAQRAYRISQALLKRFDKVYVITLDSKKLSASFLDEIYDAKIINNDQIILIKSLPILGAIEYSEKQSLIKKSLFRIFNHLFCSVGIDWIWAVKKSLKNLDKNLNIKLLVATGSPFITFAPTIKWARLNSCKVILDYRDLWTQNPRTSYYKFFRKINYWLLECKLKNRADLLTTVSIGCQKTLKTKNLNTPVKVLYNTPDKEYIDYFNSIKEVQKGQLNHYEGFKNIVFTGQIYKDCTFKPVLQALSRISPILSSRIKIHYYGPNSKLAKMEFSYFGLENILVDHGKVSKQKSIQAILSADLLLSLIDSGDFETLEPSRSGIITTKIFDYLLSGLPILNIGSPNLEIITFAKLIGYKDFQNIQAKSLNELKDFFQKFILNSEKLPINNIHMPDFSDNFTSILDDVFKSVY
jgi:hypothetical protein